MNKDINFPFLDENTSLGDFGNYLEGLNALLDNTIRMQTEARLAGQPEQEVMLGLEAKELHNFLKMLSFVPLSQHSQVSLPAMAKESRTLAIDAATIEDDIEEAIIIKAECEKHGHKEVITAKLNSPKQKEHFKDIKERIAEVVKRTQMDGVDLFTSDRTLLDGLKLKRTTTPKDLTEEEHKMLFAVEMRQTLCELLGSGGRNEAVSFIRDYMFRPDSNATPEEQEKQKYTVGEAHALLEALKDEYDIKEPTKRQELVVDPRIIPTNTYLHITYESENGKKNNLTDFIYITMGDKPGSRIVKKVGSNTIVCDIRKISSFRKVNRYEERTTIKQLKEAYKKVLGNQDETPF